MEDLRKNGLRSCAPQDTAIRTPDRLTSPEIRITRLSPNAQYTKIEQIMLGGGNMAWNWNAEKTARWLTPAPEIEEVARRWKSLGFSSVLDRGCGPGRHAMYFARQGFAVTGMDLSEEALQYLAKWAAEERLSVRTVSGDMFCMPFPDNTFDCVLDYNVSYHTDTAGYCRAAAELQRVLRPGGEAYLTLLSQNDPGFLTAPPEQHLDRFTLVREGSTPHFYASEADFGEIFAGFTQAEPPREIAAPGLDNPAVSVHYHLLLRKEETV